MAILLSAPGDDFEGGEFVLTEQRPRSQSRADVVPLGQGEAVIFAVNQRPAEGARGFYRLTMRHGVSRVRAGERYTLGIIFHDNFSRRRLTMRHGIARVRAGERYTLDITFHDPV